MVEGGRVERGNSAVDRVGDVELVVVVQSQASKQLGTKARRERDQEPRDRCRAPSAARHRGGVQHGDAVQPPRAAGRQRRWRGGRSCLLARKGLLTRLAPRVPSERQRPPGKLTEIDRLSQSTTSASVCKPGSSRRRAAQQPPGPSTSDKNVTRPGVRKAARSGALHGSFRTDQASTSRRGTPRRRRWPARCHELGAAAPPVLTMRSPGARRSKVVRL